LAQDQRKLSAAVLFGALILAFLWPRPSLAELLAHGDDALQRENWAEAYHDYQLALLTDPKNATIHLKLAQVYESSANFDQAVTELARAKELNSDAYLDTEISRLTNLRDEPKKLRQDLAEVTRLLAAHPDFRNAWFKAAFLHYRLREDLSAKKALQRALDLDPNYEPALKLSALLP
jgi:tetratricopeptide (TPR) repeat protein